MGGKKDKKKIGNFSSVSARYFLEKFCGVNSDSAKTMNHEAIRDLLPSLKRTSFAHVLKNPELINTRQVVIVEDFERHIIPYVVPKNILPIDEEFTPKKDQVLNQILSSIDTVIQLSETTTLLIECNSSLNDYIIKPKKISNEIDNNELSNRLIEANYIKMGIMINFAGSLYTYEALHKSLSTSNEDFLLEISAVTDAIIVIVEPNGDISVLVDGKQYGELDLSLLKLELSTHFDFVNESQGELENIELSNYRLDSMSQYELEELMKYYKSSGQDSFYHVVRRELIKRTLPNKQHKVEKEKQKCIDYGDEIK